MVVLFSTMWCQCDNTSCNTDAVNKEESVLQCGTTRCCTVPTLEQGAHESPDSDGGAKEVAAEEDQEEEGAVVACIHCCRERFQTQKQSNHNN